MRHKDRRFQSAPYVFFLSNYQEMKAALGAINFSAKKTKKFNQADFLKAVAKKDVNYDAKVAALFPKLRGHAAYWSERKKELDNMCK